MYKTVLHMLSKLPVVKSSPFLINLFAKLTQICEYPSVRYVWYHMVVAHTAKKPNRSALRSRCCAEC